MSAIERSSQLGTYYRILVMSATHAINDGALLALIPLIPLVTDEFHLDTVQIGLLTGIASLTSGILQMPVSFVADHTGRKRTVLGLGLLLISAAYVLYALSPSYLLLLAVGALLGVAGSGYHPCAMAMVAEQFDKARKAFFLAIHAAGANVGMSFIPIIVGFLAYRWGWRPAIGVMAIPAAVIAVLTLLSMHEQRAAKVSLKGSLSDVWNQVLRNRFLLVLAAIGGSHSAAYFGILPFIPLFLKETYGWGTDTIGLGLGVLNGMGIITQPFIGHLADRVGRQRVMAVSLVFVAIFTFAFPTFQYAWLVYPLFACLGVALFCLWPLMAASVTDFADQRTVSSAVGLNFTLNSTCSFLAPAIVGGIVKATSLSVGLYWGPVFFLLACSLTILLIRMTATARRQSFEPALQ